MVAGPTPKGGGVGGTSNPEKGNLDAYDGFVSESRGGIESKCDSWPADVTPNDRKGNHCNLQHWPISSFHALVFFLINNTSCVSPELDSYSSNTPDRMSGRRSPSRQSISPSITDEQINDLMAKLEAVLPEARLGISHRVGMRATSYCVQVSARKRPIYHLADLHRRDRHSFATGVHLNRLIIRSIGEENHPAENSCRVGGAGVEQCVKAKENMKIAFLNREFEVCPNRSVKEEFSSVFKEEMEIAERLDKVRRALENSVDDLRLMGRLLDELDLLQRRAQDMDLD
ncbi:hypothetical protein GW17_00007466 [Ensete ventricosum]|nr:hypothetical protein GW17_00007466 [Ensete ventricosum]